MNIIEDKKLDKETEAVLMNLVEFKKLDGENEEQFLWRLGQAKDNGLVDMDWEEIAAIMNKEFREEDNYFQSSAYRKPYQQAKRFFEKGVFDKVSQPGYIEQIDEAKHQIEVERKKFQSEKLEYNKWLREEARDELIGEKIVEAIKKLPLLEMPKEIKSPAVSDSSYLLAFGDAHYGIEYEIKGLNGEIINQYSPEEFKNRMFELLAEVKEVVNKENIKELHVFEMGDGIQGIIRINSQLLKLRTGIIGQTMEYADFLAHWLNQLSEVVKVKFHMVIDSNHCQLRLLGQPKNAFAEENMSKVIRAFLQERLKNNPNIEMISNPTGMNFCNLAGFNILGIHGEVSNLSGSINDFSRAYGTQIDYLIAGHCHHKTAKENGVNSETLTVGSVIGVDPYGMSLNKTSNASASMFEFKKKKGKVKEYTFKLN